MIQRKLFIYWLCAFFISAVVLSNTHWQSSNDDSKYYTQMVVRNQDLSWQKVLTPKWGVNYYSFDPLSYMRDQLPGQLILGLAVTRLGVPADQALQVLGMIFQILSFFLLVKISEEFISFESASILYYGLILTPMSFSYNLRANHELGIMFFCFLALYSGLKLSSSKWWSLTSAISCMMLLMIKGPFFVFGFILTVVGFIFANKRAALRNQLLTLSAGAFLVLLSATIYERLYVSITGESFFLEFYKIQIQQRALPNLATHSFLIQKFLNFYYYFSHYLIYALPWSLLVVLTILKNIKTLGFKMKIYIFLKSPISLCLLSAAFSFCCLFTLSDRTATRYVFPAYYLFSAWSLLFLLNMSPAFIKLNERLNRFGVQFVAPIVWFFAFALHFLKI